MNAATIFEHWRQLNPQAKHWELAWYLAHEICARFHGSHGVVPWVITHHELGYHGIELNAVRCAVRGNDLKPYGRLTITGDVENWRGDSPDDHVLQTVDRYNAEEPTEELVRAAIKHLGFSPYPSKSHDSCRHKRWAGSYELCFEVAAILAIRHGPDNIAIWNHPAHTARVIAELDPKAGMREHPGAFLFESGDRRIVVAGDGRVLQGAVGNIWETFMSGVSPVSIAELIELALFRFQ